MAEQTRIYHSTLSVSADDLFAWHAHPGALERLTPPWMNVRVVSQDGIGDGDRATVNVPIAGPIRTDWTLTHERLVDGIGFADVQQSGPFRSWRHEHRFMPNGHDSSILEDRLTYALPLGALGEVVAGRRVGQTLDDLFAFRHLQTRADLERLAAVPEQRLHVAITGASGLVGKRLVSFLQAGGHRVSRLVRHWPQGEGEIFWDPAKGEIDASSLEGVDAVIHLAGVSIASGRWTASRKQAIRSSRVDGTSLLARTLAELRQPPRVFVSTSAVGYYGDAGSAVLTEDSPAGKGFLADVCVEWEAAASPAAAAGIRVVHPRFGVVMAGEGGMLPLLARVFKAGVGGPLGNGKQYMAWIAMDDLIGILYESVTNESLSGPVNAVAPELTTNAMFTRAMGKALYRPTLFRTPAFVMRALGGELADDLILASQGVSPGKLGEAGFRFMFPTIESAIRYELGRGVAGLAPGDGETALRLVAGARSSRNAA